MTVVLSAASAASGSVAHAGPAEKAAQSASAAEALDKEYFSIRSSCLAKRHTRAERAASVSPVPPPLRRRRAELFVAFCAAIGTTVHRSPARRRLRHSSEKRGCGRRPPWGPARSRVLRLSNR